MVDFGNLPPLVPLPNCVDVLCMPRAAGGGAGGKGEARRRKVFAVGTGREHEENERRCSDVTKSGAQEEAACGVSRNAERPNAASTEEGVAAVPVWRGRLSFDVVVRLASFHSDRPCRIMFMTWCQARNPGSQKTGEFPIHRVKGCPPSPASQTTLPVWCSLRTL